MIARRVLIALSVLAMASCQSQAPTEKPAPEEGKAAQVEAAPAKVAPAKAPAPAGLQIENKAPVLGDPSDLATTIVPGDVDWFGALDLRGLKGTILERQFRPWIGYLNTIPKYQQLVAETGAGELLGHALVMGGTFSPDTILGFDLFGAVFGLKSEAKMATRAAELIAKDAPPPAREFQTGHKEGTAAWLAGPSLAGKVAALLEGKGESVNDDDTWVELQRNINTHAPIWALVRIPELLRAQFPMLHRAIPGLQFFPGVTEFLGMTHAAMSIDLGDRLEVRVALKLKSPEDALVVVEQLEMAAEATLWEPTLFFDTFQIHAAGPMVTLRAATSQKAWRVTVFWLSIAAQAIAFEELSPKLWEKQEETRMGEEKAMIVKEIKEKVDEVPEEQDAHTPAPAGP